MSKHQRRDIWSNFYRPKTKKTNESNSREILPSLQGDQARLQHVSLENREARRNRCNILGTEKLYPDKVSCRNDGICIWRDNKSIWYQQAYIKKTAKGRVERVLKLKNNGKGSMLGKTFFKVGKKYLPFLFLIFKVILDSWCKIITTSKIALNRSRGNMPWKGGVWRSLKEILFSHVSYSGEVLMLAHGDKKWMRVKYNI